MEINREELYYDKDGKLTGGSTTNDALFQTITTEAVIPLAKFSLEELQKEIDTRKKAETKELDKEIARLEYQLNVARLKLAKVKKKQKSPL